MRAWMQSNDGGEQGGSLSFSTITNINIHFLYHNYEYEAGASMGIFPTFLFFSFLKCPHSLVFFLFGTQDNSFTTTSNTTPWRWLFYLWS